MTSPPRHIAAALPIVAALVVPVPAAAETCFRQCLAGRVTSSSLADEAIRREMRGCRDRCDGDLRARLAAPQRAGLDACRPEPLSIEAFRTIRGASPSYVVQSNAFTWDVTNPLPDRVIREIEITTQSIDLRDVVLTAPTLIPPGATETVVAAGFFDGYPGARYATRITAILACPLP